MDGLVNRLKSEKVNKVKENKYNVKAIWKTLQGEGLFAGRPAVFVRMVGCNMWSGYEHTRERDAKRNGASCPLWCDTDFTNEGSLAYTAEELAIAITKIAEDVRFCVLTGGEPLLQIDATLIKALHGIGFFIAIETNGTASLVESCWDATADRLEAPDWVVCSPKQRQEKLLLEFFDELKLVVPDYMPQDYGEFAKRQRIHIVQSHPLPLLWLQPEDGLRIGEATDLAINTALAYPSWRVSVQTHKILEVE
jgi:7-carboxy-7-deazaguanine synthase